jgi:hypothetical protein
MVVKDFPRTLTTTATVSFIECLRRVGTEMIHILKATKHIGGRIWWAGRRSTPVSLMVPLK